MFQHMLFADVGGRPVARTLRAQGGVVRSADGVTFFSLDQAVDHFNLARQTLVEMWNDAFAELPWAASPIAGAAADAGGEPEPAENPPGGEVVGPPRDERPAAVLRRVVGGHLSDDEWEYYLELCRRRGFDPWSRQVIPRREEDARGGEVRISIITTVAALVLTAQRSREYEGQTAPQWCGTDLEWRDGWPDDVMPFMARVGVHRRGFREPVWGVVHWKDRAPYWPVPDGKGGVTVELDPFWQQQGRHMLAKCARADALRNAFAEELAGVYTFDEMAQADARRRSPRAGAGDGEMGGAVDPLEIPSGRVVPGDWPSASGRGERIFEPLHQSADDSIPRSDEEFDAFLRKMGFPDADVRAKVIRYFHGLYPTLFHVNEMAAYAKAMEAVRSNPEHFGATAARRRSFANAN